MYCSSYSISCFLEKCKYYYRFLLYFCGMIFVAGFGQMCNNILQFGHLYAWGRKRGISVIALRFCYKYLYFAISKTKHYHWFTYLFAKYGAKLRLFPVVSLPEEEDVSPEKIAFLQKARFVLIKGWGFRDYDAFLAYRDEIKNLFAFRRELTLKVDKCLPALKENVLRLGVHIRRGDYKTWMSGHYYYSDEDFIRVIQLFHALFPDNSIEILIVGNEKKLPQEKYRAGLPEPIYFLSGNRAEDLYALSTCNYLIGPPSTFSLTAAFYNDSNLYWILDKNQPLSKESFQKFDYLFRNII